MSESEAKYSPELCKVRHDAFMSEIEHVTEKVTTNNTLVTDRIDKLDAKLNMVIMAILTTIGGILSPIVLDLVRKLIGMPK